MASRNPTALSGATSPVRASALPAVPKLDDVQQAIDDESNVSRILHRLAQDMRENLPEGIPLDLHADLDALVSELGRLEQRLGALAESLDVHGCAEMGAPRLRAVDDQEGAA